MCCERARSRCILQAVNPSPPHLPAQHRLEDLVVLPAEANLLDVYALNLSRDAGGDHGLALSRSLSGEMDRQMLLRQLAPSASSLADRLVGRSPVSRRSSCLPCWSVTPECRPPTRT
jgi:hypothetical protein